MLRYHDVHAVGMPDHHCGHYAALAGFDWDTDVYGIWCVHGPRRYFLLGVRARNERRRARQGDVPRVRPGR